LVSANRQVGERDNTLRKELEITEVHRSAGAIAMTGRLGQKVNELIEDVQLREAVLCEAFLFKEERLELAAVVFAAVDYKLQRLLCSLTDRLKRAIVFRAVEVAQV